MTSVPVWCNFCSWHHMGGRLTFSEGDPNLKCLRTTLLYTVCLHYLQWQIEPALLLVASEFSILLPFYDIITFCKTSKESDPPNFGKIGLRFRYISNLKDVSVLLLSSSSPFPVMTCTHCTTCSKDPQVWNMIEKWKYFFNQSIVPFVFIERVHKTNGSHLFHFLKNDTHP